MINTKFTFLVLLLVNINPAMANNNIAAWTLALNNIDILDSLLIRNTLAINARAQPIVRPMADHLIARYCTVAEFINFDSYAVGMAPDSPGTPKYTDGIESTYWLTVTKHI